MSIHLFTNIGYIFFSTEPIRGIQYRIMNLYVIHVYTAASRLYCWWFRNPAPVEVGSLSHYLQGFKNILPSVGKTFGCFTQFHSAKRGPSFRALAASGLSSTQGIWVTPDDPVIKVQQVKKRPFLEKDLMILSKKSHPVNDDLWWFTVFVNDFWGTD